MTEGFEVKKVAVPRSDSGLSLPMAAYFGFAFLSSFNIGAYLILLSWTATEITGDASLVGSLFLTALALGLVLANFTGVVADRGDTGIILLSANAVQISAGLILVSAFFGMMTVTSGLILFTAVRVVGGAFSATASASVFQRIFRKEVRTKRIAEIGICNQIGIASGSGVAGLFMIHPGEQWLSASLVCITVIQAPLILAFVRRSEPQREARASGVGRRKGLLSDWREGFSYIGENRSIAICLLVIAASFSVAQLTNTLVPSFVMNDLGQDSSSYGALEAAWAVGGTLVLLLVRRLRSSSSSHRTDFLFLGATGGVMVLFALNRSIGIAFLLYFVLGALFSLTRTLANARMMTETDNQVIGRVVSTGQILTNVVGIAIFSLPWFIETSTVTYVYIGWGSVMLVAAVAIAMLTRRQSA